jgi:hypothetical protein
MLAKRYHGEVIGYQIGGRLYHPADVIIVREEAS